MSEENCANFFWEIGRFLDAGRTEADAATDRLLENTGINLLEIQDFRERKQRLIEILEAENVSEEMILRKIESAQNQDRLEDPPINLCTELQIQNPTTTIASIRQKITESFAVS